MSDPCVTVLPLEQVIGLSFTAFTGFLSAFAVIFVLGLVARNYLRNMRNPPPGGEWKLIRTHVDAYLLSLLASDLMQSLGAIIDVKWAAERQVYCSPTCTTQGVIQVIGETGVAMGTLAITIHTFLVIFFRWSPSPRSSWIWKLVITSIWLYVCLYGIIGYATHHRPADRTADLDDFYTPTPYWCWISSNFIAEKITAEYLWLWLAAFSSIILYTLLFFRVRGNITVDPLDWRRIRFKWHRWHTGDDEAGDGYFDGPGRGARGGEAGKTAAREAMSMIWYPLTYTALVLPLSIVRWSTFRPIGQAEPNVPFAVTCVVVTIFGLSGIANVVLILLTRKNLLLFGQRGVVNPAKIGPAALGRLPPAAAKNNHGGGGGGPAEKKDRFHFRNVVIGKHHGDGKQEIAEDSTGDTSEDQRRQRPGGGGQGDTSFAAGRFTTQAFETQRSFDVGSNRMPFSPTSGPTDTANTTSMPSGVVTMDEEQSYGYEGYGYGGHAQEGGIPEGMSRDLGSATGEYDVDREREWRSFGSVQQQQQQPSTNVPMYLVPGDEGETTQGDVSNPSNFLEMKDSRSNPGQPEQGAQDYPHYPPQPAPAAQHHQQSQSQQLYAEGRRGSAGTTSKNPGGGGSRPNSAKSKTGSSYHRPSGDAKDDYSVPMKFNPTPAPVPPVPPPQSTRTNTDASDSRSPYASKSRNGSSKSLGKATPATTTTETTTKLPWSGITSMFSKSTALDKPDRSKYEYGSSPPNSGQSDSRLLVPAAGAAAGATSHPSQQEAATIRPLHFSHDFGPKLRSSLSLRTPDAELERSPFDDTARMERAPSHEALALARTRTGNSSHEGGGGGAGTGNVYGGSWSRASAGGRRAGAGEDEGYPSFRPATAGSNRSYTSYTFGPPGFATGGGTAAASTGSLRDPSATERGVEMQERPRQGPMQPSPPSPNAQTIGRAL